MEADDHPDAASDPEDVVAGISYRWRAPVEPGDIDALVGAAFGGGSRDGWWRRVRPRSLGWVTAHDGDTLVGFVNVVTDGDAHAFLLDTAVAGTHRRRGIGTLLVEQSTRHAQSEQCEWLHVDFEEGMSGFYLDACGFRPTAAGLIRLSAT